MVIRRRSFGATLDVTVGARPAETATSVALPGLPSRSRWSHLAPLPSFKVLPDLGLTPTQIRPVVEQHLQLGQEDAVDGGTEIFDDVAPLFPQRGDINNPRLLAVRQ